MVKYLCVGLVALSSLALSACNTVRGVGEDVEAAGKVISKTADDVQKK